MLLLLQPEKLVSKLFCLEKFNSLCLIDSTLNQTRRLTTPCLPNDIDFDIPRKFKQTTDGERYLLADRVQRCEGEVDNRILVFATDEQLNILFTSSHILMDGTFHCSPSHFHQVYSIHGVKNNHSKFFIISYNYALSI